MKNKFYVTTSIAYVNAKPHIGYAMELIQGDALARFHRLRGADTFYLTGTDEHGSKIAQTAAAAGVTPQQLTDENAGAFKDLVSRLNISADRFIRTTEAEHIKSSQKIWSKMAKSGDIYPSEYEGLYCVGCEAFVLEKDLVDGLCPNHNKPPEKLKEKNYFFKLSKYSDQIKKLIKSGELKIIPEGKRKEILSVLDEGLKDVSFSRPKSVLKWGIDVPEDDSQVMYVWCDALTNYITGVGFAEGTAQFKKFWPADVHLIGKDILRFHSAIWIGMLLSAGIDLPKAIYVHGHITSDGKKMSKSLNNVVDPNEYIEKFGVDPLRYFLLKEIPTTDDGDFSKERFGVVYDSELANNIGNLVSRVLAMTGKYFDFKVPDGDPKKAVFVPKLVQLWNDYESAFADYDLKKSLETAAELANTANKFVEDNKPWVLAKENQEELKSVIYVLLEMIRHLALMLAPFIPASAEKIIANMGFADNYFKDLDFTDAKKWAQLKSGQIVVKPEPMFMRISS